MTILGLAAAGVGDAGTEATSIVTSPVGAPGAAPHAAPHVPPVAPVPAVTARPPAAPAAPVATTPAPPPVPDALAMGAAEPVRLSIPSIGVDTPLLGLGLQDDGTLQVPPSGFPAGWFTGAPTPGELGPAIIAGHVDWGGEPGVFFDLRDLVAGDPIDVERHDGSTARFAVTRVEPFAKDGFPTQAVYGDLDHAGLRLITCGGSFDHDVGSYEDNLVVFAELVGSDTPD